MRFFLSQALLLLFSTHPWLGLGSPPPSSCTFSLPLGTLDLFPLGPLRHFSPDSGWVYGLSACDQLVPRAMDPRVCGAVAPAPALQITRGQCLTLGTLASRRVAQLEGAALGVSVAYSGGDAGRRFQLALTCADGPTTVDAVQEEKPGEYFMVARSRAACPLECARDPATGAVCGGTGRGACMVAAGGTTASCACNAGHWGPHCTAESQTAGSDTHAPSARPLLGATALLALSGGAVFVAAKSKPRHLLFIASCALVCCGAFLLHSLVLGPATAAPLSVAPMDAAAPLPATAVLAPAPLHTTITPASPFYNLSYPLPNWFPFPAGHRMVMETVPGTCDLLWDGGTPAPCAAFGARRSYEPDPHVREAIASVLHGCAHCACIDVGANIGVMTALMASLGSSVVSVEPQLDLAEALKKTVALNGWDNRVRVLAGFATMLLPSERRSRRMAISGLAFRPCGWPEPGASDCFNPKSTPWDAPFINVREEMRALKHVDLIKVDTDAVDGEMLQGILDEVASGAVNVTSVICEFEKGTAKMLWDFQQLGYHIYRLNVHLGARHFDRTGRDTLHHYKKLDLPTYYEERYFSRFMRYALKVKHLGDVGAFTELMASESEKASGGYCGGPCIQWLFTQIDMEEDTFLHPLDGPTSDQFGYIHPSDGPGSLLWKFGLAKEAAERH